MPTENRSTDPRDLFINLNPLGLTDEDLRKDTTGFADERTHADYLVFLAGINAMQPRIGMASDRANRIYIAGPMTGLPEFNFPAFHAMAATMRDEGWHVENPAEHGIADGAEWADYLRYDIGRLATCEQIMLLPGWSKSKGANLEVHIARQLGMPIKLAEGAEPAEQHQGEPVERDERAEFEAAYALAVDYGWSNVKHLAHYIWQVSGALERKSSALVAQLQTDLTARDELIDRLLTIGVRGVCHVNNGSCPDEVEGFTARDDERPACQALMDADLLLSKS